jgi:predicted nucleic acid-binding protein
VEHSGVRVVRLTPADLIPVLDARKRLGLDFDDAYQYVTAKKYGYTFLSFDTDFDRTDLQRKTPGDILSA